jgi:hypothetical protein
MTTVLPLTGPDSVPASAKARGTTSPSRILAIVVITLLVLFMLGFVLQLVAAGLHNVGASQAGSTAPVEPPADSPVVLSSVAAATILARSPSTSTALVHAKKSLAAAMQQSLRQFPGVTDTYLEFYGPGPAGSPARGAGVIVVAWGPTSAQFGVAQTAAGFADGAREKGHPVLGPVAESDGARITCETGPSGSVCLWVRSGTGVVEVTELQVPAPVVQADTLSIVTTLTDR